MLSGILILYTLRLTILRDILVEGQIGIPRSGAQGDWKIHSCQQIFDEGKTIYIFLTL